MTPLMSNAFAADLEGGQPPVMSVKHRGRLLRVKLDGGRPHLTFFRDHFAPVAFWNDKPRVIGTNAGSSPVPAQTAVGYKFMDLAVDGKAEGFPSEDTASLEPTALRALDLDFG